LALLTTEQVGGNMLDMEAVVVERTKQRFNDGYILEIVIWKIPRPVPGSDHLFKYRLYYGRPGERIVGFDNERGKGDHCHLDGAEFPYRFSTPAALVQDFRQEILKRRSRP
jgi:Family of unknown function (DUF6516)